MVPLRRCIFLPASLFAVLVLLAGCSLAGSTDPAPADTAQLAQFIRQTKNEFPQALARRDTNWIKAPANGIVYIGGWYNVPGFTRKGSLYAVNAVTGQLVWEKLTSTGISSSSTVANGTLFITADDGNIHALNAATGVTLWKKEILANSASPAVSNGVVYAGGGGTHYIYAFDAATGAEKWRLPTTGLMTSCPLIITPLRRSVLCRGFGIVELKNVKVMTGENRNEEIPDSCL